MTDRACNPGVAAELGFSEVVKSVCGPAFGDGTLQVVQVAAKGTQGFQNGIAIGQADAGGHLRRPAGHTSRVAEAAGGQLPGEVRLVRPAVRSLT